MSNRAPGRGGGQRATRRRVWWFAGLLCGVLLAVLSRPLMGTWRAHHLIVATLYVGRMAYVAAIAAAALAFAVGTAAAFWARSRHQRWQLGARWALLGAAILMMIVPIELIARRLDWSHRLLDLPTDFDAAPSTAGRPTYTIVVVGESSARGEPYDISIAQIAAWQLERVLPGTHFDVDIRARGGLNLEQAISYLQSVERRPDAVLVYSGHNEFQERFRWSRTVPYYVDDNPRGAPSSLFDRAVEFSPLCRLIEHALERHRLDQPPPPRATRELIDRPVCTASEYAFLLEDYRVRLDHLLAWCNRIGAVPIVVVPAGNDTDFPPAPPISAPCP